MFDELVRCVKLSFFKSLFLQHSTKLKDDVWYSYSVKLRRCSEGHFSIAEETLLEVPTVPYKD